MFGRGKVPLTKEEIRVLTLAKARLAPGQTVYDIGSGTGSLTVESARLVVPGTVYAVEEDSVAADLTRANVRAFGLENVVQIGGRAPEALEGLPPADRIIIGGSGGRLKCILERCSRALKPRGIIVINAVTLDTLWDSLTFGRHQGYETSAVAVTVARLEEVGGRCMFRSLNPVYIVRLADGPCP
ncbi:MAG TPA: precorrin-6Y C5,15-methyltransferase (decarboxylating) subunit CbiT [Peptococcaceae bacterium]|nr:MAG: SAM (And some other nucleotide) binding protein [Moorella sp. 60_41]HBT47333.1 precorrin-6Y C5,15-methyltransferase (decarboxylating) subunit CbiT [Peptococcaceae bacterium]